MTSCRPSVCRPAGRSESDAFLELLYADEELVRVEFEAIVAAEWPRPPDRRAAVRSQHVGEDGGPAPSRTRTSPSEPAVERQPGVDAWARERSPPNAG
jgi:hypothetical protein